MYQQKLPLLQPYRYRRALTLGKFPMIQLYNISGRVFFFLHRVIYFRPEPLLWAPFSVKRAGPMARGHGPCKAVRVLLLVTIISTCVYGAVAYQSPGEFPPPKLKLQAPTTTNESASMGVPKCKHPSINTALFFWLPIDVHMSVLFCSVRPACSSGAE
jgi:hypothetical protein